MSVTQPSMQAAADIVAGVRCLLKSRVENLADMLAVLPDAAPLMPGKMLRTRLAARLAATGSVQTDPWIVQRACAATEMAHTASLCHDDVIDNGLIRRGLPSLWQTAGASAAVLIGDVLVCEALRLVVDTCGGRYTQPFVAKLHELCVAETEHELMRRGTRMDEATCLRVARGKTGPLFAFLGLVCGGDDEILCDALEEAGYRIGTAYQLADDLIDLVGSEDTVGKSLGTDVRRGKFTLPQGSEPDHSTVSQYVTNLWRSSLDVLQAWPDLHRALGQFLVSDLHPALRRAGLRSEVCEVP